MGIGSNLKVKKEENKGGGPEAKDRSRKPNSRAVAWDALNQVRRGVYLEDLLDKAFFDTHLNQQERSFAVELANGVTRWRLRLDYLIALYSSDPSRAMPKELRNLLRLGLYQLFFLDHIPAHAAVDLTVEMAKQQLGKPISGFANAVLRRALREKDRLHDPDPRTEPARHLSIVFSHPLWLMERWLDRYGFESCSALCQWNNRPPVVYLRANSRRISSAALREELLAAGLDAGDIAGDYIPLRRPGHVGSIAAIKEGRAYVQDPSSGFVVDLIAAREGERIADLCVAPGGKAAGVGETIGLGLLAATDLDLGRLMIAKSNLERLGTRALYSVADGQSPAFRPGSFDAVLLDAPCSNTGVLSRRPESRWEKGPDDIARLSMLQARMLLAAAALVKRGGRLVYSTCSLEPEENENAVRAFLAQNPDFTLAPARGFVPEKYDRDGFLRILPWVDRLDGIFGARLERIR